MRRNPVVQPRLTPLVLQLPRQYEALDSRHASSLFDLGTEAVYMEAELFERHEQGGARRRRSVAPRDCCWGWTGGTGCDRVGPSGAPWGADLGKGSWEMRGGKAMSLLDASLANARALGRRPVMERVL